MSKEATLERQREPVGSPVLPTILVVDDDRVSCKYLEVALTRAHKYNVEVAFDVGAAMDTLSNCVVDLIVSDLRMPEVDGFGFINRLKREGRLTNIPVVLLTTDDRVASKLTGFQLGVYDYVTKPFQIQEFLARIDAIIQRSARERQLLKRSYNLAGDFTGISFCDLVNLFAFGQRSGVLSIITPRSSGKLYFVNGNLHNVAFGNLEGPEAFWAIMTQKAGQFEFCPKDFANAPPERTILQSPMSLLMEGARRMDESGGGQDSELVCSSATTSGSKSEAEPQRATEGRRAAAKPTAALVATMEEGIGAPFTLGELVLMNRAELLESGEMAGHEARFHVVLVTEIGGGTAALASLAAPLSEQQVAKAVCEGNLSAVLTFSMQGGLSADVLLVDQTDPIRDLDDLRLSPSVLLLAPKDGDWLSMGVEARADLASLYAKLRPDLIAGLGNDSVAQGVQELVTPAEWKAPTHFISGSLSDVGFDFRETLVEALRQWGRTGQASKGN